MMLIQLSCFHPHKKASACWLRSNRRMLFIVEYSRGQKLAGISAAAPRFAASQIELLCAAACRNDAKNHDGC